MKNPSPRFASLWAVTATFGAYFCMYGFRKPFAVATYSEVEAWGHAYKPLAVAVQVFGYMASKFVGIRVIAEMRSGRRVATLLGLIAVAEAALVGFGQTPAPWNVLWLFLNGLALGLVFGLVLSFLEGRRHTEALAAGLCSSFVLADGITKSVAAKLLAQGCPQFWMPAATGALFAVPLIAFAWMLTRIAPPSPEDVALRSERLPMAAGDRKTFLRRYGVGLALITAVYVLVTIIRSVRSDFAPEIWKGLGVEATPADFAGVETWVALAVLAIFGTLTLVVDNRRAYFLALGYSGAGCAILAATPALRVAGASPFLYMTVQGLGLYLPYIAVHTTIFERLIAATRERGNIGYLMYLADAFGYCGYVAVLLTRMTTTVSENFLRTYEPAVLVTAAASAMLLVPCWAYFSAHEAFRRAEVAPEPGSGIVDSR